MTQEIIAFTALAVALAFLIKKFFWKKKSKGGCDTDCGC
jgi:membrane protein implicated in regulation of membrane protease activity